MAKFREFSVPAGGGSNFLAGMCFRTTEENNHKDNQTTNNILTNEFFFERGKINNLWNNIPEYKEMIICDDKDLISHTKRILPILIELNKIITIKNGKDNDSTVRDRLLTFLKRGAITLSTSEDAFWRQANTFQYCSFLRQLVPGMYSTDKIPESVMEILSQVEDYFARCREHYFKICEQNDWNSFIISHIHSFNSISPRLKLPKNFKSLAMELDSETNMVLIALWSIKGNDPNIQKIENGLLTDGITYPNIVNTSCVNFSDETVSYRKIFFENDTDEIMKIYDFFDDKEWFQQNRVQIMKEFREYHDKNMSVMQKSLPNLYKQLKPR